MTPNSHDKPAPAGGEQETALADGGGPESRAARAQRFFFGDDVFVSYARHDSDYALRLADELTRRNLSCFLDQWGTPPGVELPPELVERLKKSTLLVLIGTRRAAASENVMKEVVEFKKTGRPIIPITFVDEEVFASIRDGRIPEGLTGTLEAASWYGEIAGIARTVESRAALKAGREGETVKPSSQVITRVVNAEGFVSRNTRLRRVFKATLLSLLALLVAAGVVTTLLVSNARADMNTALKQQKGAETKASEAEGKRAAAERAQADAERARADADEARTLAEGKTKKAEEDLTTAQAETKRAAASLLVANKDLHEAQIQKKEATALAAAARLEAERQQEVALTRRLANQSSLTLRQKPELLARSVSLAVEAAKRSQDLGVRSLEADMALRESLGLMPLSLGARSLGGGITRVAFSPGAETVVTLTKPQGAGGKDKEVLSVRRASDGGEVAPASQCDCGAIAVSRDGERVATAMYTGDWLVRVRETKGSGLWDVPVANTDDSVIGVALSPDGKYLLMALMNADADEGETFAELWNVEKKERVTRLNTQGYIHINAAAFSPRGRYFAVTGSGIGARGRGVGRTLIWEVLNAFDESDTDENNVSGPDAFMQEGDGSALALDDDGRYLATTSGNTALVWIKSDRGGYEQVARVPLGQRIGGLAFDAEAKTLSTTSVEGEVAEGGVASRVLEKWDFAGYWEAFNATYSSEITGLAFSPGGESVTTTSDAFKKGEHKIRFWRVSDGTEVKAANPAPGESDERPVSMSEGARLVVTQLDGGGFGVWDVRARKAIAVPPEPGYESLEQPVLSPDGAVMARVCKKPSAGGFTVMAYKLDGDAYKKTAAWDTREWPGEFSISPSGEYLVASVFNKPVELLSLSDGHDITPSGVKAWGKVTSTNISTTGNLLAAVVSEGGPRESLRVWDVSRGREVKSVPGRGTITTYALSRNDRYLAVADSEGLVRTFDLSGKDSGSVRHDASVSALAFSPDESYLASGDEAGMMRVIETKSWDEVARMPHFGIVKRIAFSEDGSRVAASTDAPKEDYADRREAHMLHVWLLNPAELIKEACRRLERFTGGAGESRYCKAGG